MMKKNMKKKSTARKLLPAAGMLAVSASMLATSTYAWFTMNREVTVTGMTMHTKVSENLLIADDTLTSTAIKGDQYFNNSLVQLNDGFIEPVSTIDGKAFFYTAGTNVQGNGDVLNKNWTAYDPTDTSEFAEEYALTESADISTVKGYIDYVYQLKAINGSTPSEIRLTGLNLTYGGDGDNSQKATRVAVFAEDLGYKTGSDSTHLKGGTANNTAFVGGPDVLQAIYTPSGATNFESGKAVKNTTTRDTVTYNGAFTLDVAQNVTQYYKIVVRVWLEGEDTTCNNTTFMDLTDKWSLDMKWNFTADNTPTVASVPPAEDNGAVVPVANIVLANTAAKTVLSATTDTVDTTAANTKTISGVAYYPIIGKTLGGSQLYTTDSTLATTSKVYTISDDGLYPTNVTNQVTIS